MLPGVGDELPEVLGVNLGALILETRFLQPLEAFGLVEGREPPQAAGGYEWRREWRPTELLARVVSFDLGERGEPGTEL